MLVFLVLAFVASPPVARAAAHRAVDAIAQETQYVCPMHPDVVSKTPGSCPKCGMTLRARAAESTSSRVEETAGAADETAAGSGSGLSLKIPDATIYDQNGNKLRFYTDLVKGKTVAINFIFTTCTTICPPLTATFRKVQQELGDRSGRDVQLISITVDPTTDVPERLKEFAARFSAGPGWTFVTGGKSDVDQLLRALGAYVGDKNEHSPMILIGNESAGYWTRAYGLAPPATIIKLIDDAVAKPGAGKPGAAKPAADKAGADKPAEANAGAGKPATPSDAAARYFPNLVLLTQDNKPVRFYDDLMKGKVVLINFMFTTCDAICPAMTANLVKVQDYLGDHLGRDVNIISITVDPAVDTPDALKKYAEQYKTKPGWFFLTGKKENVDWVLYKLGGYVEDKTDHSTLVIIGNEATGRWAKLFAMTRPAQIADAVVAMIEKK
jgi:protein SCO1/2